MNKNARVKGMSQVVVLIGLMLMAVVLPLVANMVGKNQDNRNRAAGPYDVPYGCFCDTMTKKLVGPYCPIPGVDCSSIIKDVPYGCFCDSTTQKLAGTSCPTPGLACTSVMATCNGTCVSVTTAAGSCSNLNMVSGTGVCATGICCVSVKKAIGADCTMNTDCDTGLCKFVSGLNKSVCSAVPTPATGTKCTNYGQACTTAAGDAGKCMGYGSGNTFYGSCIVPVQRCCKRTETDDWCPGSPTPAASGLTPRSVSLSYIGDINATKCIAGGNVPCPQYGGTSCDNLTGGLGGGGNSSCAFTSCNKDKLCQSAYGYSHAYGTTQINCMTSLNNYDVGLGPVTYKSPCSFWDNKCAIANCCISKTNLLSEQIAGCFNAKYTISTTTNQVVVDGRTIKKGESYTFSTSGWKCDLSQKDGSCAQSKVKDIVDFNTVVVTASDNGCKIGTKSGFCCP